MKMFSKAVLGSLILAGTAVAVAVPAEARVGVSVNLGLFAPAPPVVVPAPAYAPAGYCYGPYYYTNCGYAVYGEPVFWGGYWYNNAPYRFVRGRREFWVNGGWHANIRIGERGRFRR
jgi:hypothetical protein